MNFKRLLALTGGIVAGQFLYGMILSRYIPTAEGFGIDDVIAAATSAVCANLAVRMFK